MPNKSIYTSDADYLSVVKKIYEQRIAGTSEQDVYNGLSAEYDAGHISLLLTYYNRVPFFRKYAKLNNALIAALWLLLFLKIFIVPGNLLLLTIPASWKAIVLGAQLVIPTLCLYFAYNNIRYPAIAIFALVGFQLLVAIAIEYIFLRYTSNETIWFVFFFTIVSLAALLLSRKLSTLFPAQSIKFYKTLYTLDKQKMQEAESQRPHLFE